MHTFALSILFVVQHRMVSLFLYSVHHRLSNPFSGIKNWVNLPVTFCWIIFFSDKGLIFSFQFFMQTEILSYSFVGISSQKAFKYVSALCTDNLYKSKSQPKWTCRAVENKFKYQTETTRVNTKLSFHRVT